MFDVEFARRQMIEQQVRAWDVLDLRVLAALGNVPREEFAPAAYRDLAFADTAVPLGHGQHMLPPSVEGRILQALQIDGGDEVLEVGTGSGFFAACIAQLARTVRTIDLFEDFVATATANLRRTGVHNVTAATADAMALAERDAYDVIALTGALPVYDARFERALKIGGRLFAAVGSGPAVEARRVTRVGGDEWVRDSLFEIGMDPLLNATQPPRFVF
jgi:protein-L-isoaspartate(D-aspartate) O-methyltransferase